MPDDVGRGRWADATRSPSPVVIAISDARTGNFVREVPVRASYMAYLARQSLSLLPAHGGTPRQLLAFSDDTRLGNLMALTFTPDSRHVVFGGKVRGVAYTSSNAPTTEVRVLEHFLPGTSPRAARAR